MLPNGFIEFSREVKANSSDPGYLRLLNYCGVIKDEYLNFLKDVLGTSGFVLSFVFLQVR